MAEWLNAAVLKTVKDASPSGVRIPVSPLRSPIIFGLFHFKDFRKEETYLESLKVILASP